MFIRIFTLLFIILLSTTFSFSDSDIADDDLFLELSESSPSSSSSQNVVYDPLRGYNQFMTGVNDVAYTYFFIPTAKGFGYVVPKPIRRGISNVFTNLFSPIRLANSLLQLKPRNAGVELARFTVNSTIGVAGLFDPASHWFNLKPVPREDFGQTLGKLGVKSGPFIVLPILGPSNLRDSVGMITDAVFDPINLTDAISDGMEIRLIRVFNEVSLNPDEYDTVKGASLDFYSFMRDSYTQRRNHQILE